MISCGRHQNETLIPALITRPSSGAHASTVQRPSTSGAGRAIGSQRVWRTSVRFVGVDEHAPAAERKLAEQVEHDVGLARRSIGVGVEPLLAGEVDLHTDPAAAGGFHRRDEAGAVPRRQRDLDGHRARASAGTRTCRSPRTARGAPCRGSRHPASTTGSASVRSVYVARSISAGLSTWVSEHRERHDEVARLVREIGRHAARGFLLERIARSSGAPGPRLPSLR